MVNNNLPFAAFKSNPCCPKCFEGKCHTQQMGPFNPPAPPPALRSQVQQQQQPNTTSVRYRSVWHSLILTMLFFLKELTKNSAFSVCFSLFLLLLWLCHYSRCWPRKCFLLLLMLKCIREWRVTAVVLRCDDKQHQQCVETKQIQMYLWWITTTRQLLFSSFFCAFDLSHDVYQKLMSPIVLWLFCVVFLDYYSWGGFIISISTP